MKGIIAVQAHMGQGILMYYHLIGALSMPHQSEIWTVKLNVSPIVGSNKLIATPLTN